MPIELLLSGHYPGEVILGYLSAVAIVRFQEANHEVGLALFCILQVRSINRPAAVIRVARETEARRLIELVRYRRAPLDLR